MNRTQNGISILDFIIEVKNESETAVRDTKYNPYILELNTLPGMTDTSDLPAQAKSAGIDSQSLIEILINSTLDS